MTTQLQLSENCVQLLDKYATGADRITRLSILVDRIAKEWIRKAYKLLSQNPGLLLDMKRKTEHIPEKEITGVKVRPVTANNFKEACKRLNLNPVDTLTMCAKAWIKMNNIAELARYKHVGAPGRRKINRKFSI